MYQVFQEMCVCECWHSEAGTPEALWARVELEPPGGPRGGAGAGFSSPAPGAVSDQQCVCVMGGLTCTALFFVC